MEWERGYRKWGIGNREWGSITLFLGIENTVSIS